MDDLADGVVRAVIGAMVVAVLHGASLTCCHDVLNGALDEPLDAKVAKWQSPPTLGMRV